MPASENNTKPTPNEDFIISTHRHLGIEVPDLLPCEWHKLTDSQQSLAIHFVSKCCGPFSQAKLARHIIGSVIVTCESKWSSTRPITEQLANDIFSMCYGKRDAEETLLDIERHLIANKKAHIYHS